MEVAEIIGFPTVAAVRSEIWIWIRSSDQRIGGRAG